MVSAVGSRRGVLSAQRELETASRDRAEASARLSAGQRINRPSDDAAGLAVSMSLTSRSRVYAQAARNIGDVESVLRIADGALGELSRIIDRQAELSVQAANGVYGSRQREAVDREANQLASEFNRIISTVSANGVRLLQGDGSPIRVQAGFGDEGGIDFRLAENFSASAGTGTYRAAGSFSIAAGNDAVGVSSADFNKDGVPDVIGSTEGFDGLHVFLGNGDGTMKAPVRYTESSGSNYHTPSADLNGDGNLDFVTGEDSTDAFSVFLGNGDGTFRRSATYTAGDRPTSTYLTDANGDGKRDVLLFEAFSRTVSVSLGNGDGTFTARRSHALPSTVYDAAPADVSGDGLADVLAIDNSSNVVRVLVGNGDGTFRLGGTYGTGASGSMSVAATDLNRDGKADAVTYSTNGSLSVLLGNGDGSFQGPRTVVLTSGTGLGAVHAADVDGDGVTDLTGSVRTAGTIETFLGNGDGSFRRGVGPVSVAGQVRDVEFVDLNRDGVPDMAVADIQNDRVRFYVADVRGTAWQRGVDLTTAEGARAAITALDGTRSHVTRAAGSVGSALSRLSSAARTVSVARDMTAAASSRITDADVAVEAARATAAEIRGRSAAAVLAHAVKGTKLISDLLGDGGGPPRVGRGT